MAIESKNLLVWVKAMSRGQGFPLDASEIYSTLAEAENYASNSAIAYGGQTVKALTEDGKYHSYVLQPSESGYTLEEVGAVNESDLKQYVMVVDALPESGQVEGILYINNTDGYVWTGSAWRKVFWDVTSDVTAVSNRVSELETGIEAKAPIENPVFTGIVKVGEEEVAVKSYVDGLFANLVSSVPGIVDSSNSLPETYKAGQTFRVAEAGTYAGVKCEVGDLILVIKNYVAETASNEDFMVLQANIDGAVTSTSELTTVGEIVVYDSVTGKVIKGSGVQIASLNDAIAKSHEHANKTVLDSYDKSQTELLAAAKSDWNQNDTTAADYVKNRPFYSGDPVETVIVEESTVAFEDGGGVYIAEWPESFEPIEGQTYTVKFDGTSYDCVCRVVDGSTIVIGNLSIAGVGDDSGEPFLIINQGACLTATLDTSASHVISISKSDQEVKKIDSKYIDFPAETDPTVPAWAKAETKPAYTASEVGALPSDTVVPVIITYDASGNLSHTFSQIQTLISNGKTCIVLDKKNKMSYLYFGNGSNYINFRNSNKQFSIYKSGTVSITDPAIYDLPVASSTRRGGIRLGDGLKIKELDSDVVSVSDDYINTLIDAKLTTLTLGQHTDGLIYIFLNGKPVGSGLGISVVAPVWGQPVADNDILSITNGQTVQLGVKLSEKPTQKQTITILSDNNELTFDETVLNFSASNWDEYQYVAVTVGEIEEDGAATITLRNSDELLTDTAITVYLVADAFNVDMTIPTEGQHICTVDDFAAHYSRNGEVSLGTYTGEYTNIVIPESMNVDGVACTPRLAVDTTFKNNTTVQYITIADNVKAGSLSLNNAATGNIDSVFTGAANLIGVKYRSNEVTSARNAFNGCASLKFVDGLELYTKNADAYQMFMGCTALEYVQDLSGWTVCGNSQSFFNNCTSLKKVYGMPATLTTLRMGFYKCAALEKAVVPAGVTDMFYCFDGCTALKEVKVYAEGVTNASSAFQGCSGVKVYVNEGSTTYTTISGQYGSSASVEILYFGGSAVPVISAWGDSTTSTGTDGEAWPTRLQTKLGESFLVKNMAISGEWCTSTSCRQGGNEASLVSDVTIPAAVEAVAVTLQSKDGQTFGTSPVLSTGANYNPVTIADVEGSIFVSGSQAYFTRKTAGDAVVVSAGTAVVSKNAVARKEDAVQVIYLGTNAGWNLDPNILLNQVQSMVAYYGGTNYIIMGPAGGQMVRTEEARAATLAYEGLAAEAFGEHWLNLREYLIANSLTENGLTATDKDNERMAVGLIPWSILLGSNTEGGTDDVHYNTHGLQSVCNAVYAKGQALGYWD